MSTESERKTEQVPEWKQREVDELVDILGDYDSIGVVDITGIPSRQLQEMRSDLYPETQLRVSRNTLLGRALEQVGGGVEELTDRIEGQVGIIGTDENPFSLFQQLEASKTPAPIGAGDVAPNDIVIEEGDTGMDPGPFVGDLQNVGAAARIQDGSIHVTEDSTVLEAGEEVSADLANVLGELGIEPKEVGLDLRAVVSDGVLFEPEDLDIDVDDYLADVETAAARARNLSVNAAYPTAATAETLIAKATGEAKSVGLQAAIEEEDLMPDLVRTADAQVRAIAAHIEDEEALPEQLRDVAAPAAAAADASTEESTDEQADEAEDTEAEAEDEDEDEDEDDEGDAAAGLGDMFG